MSEVRVIDDGEISEGGLDEAFDAVMGESEPTPASNIGVVAMTQRMIEVENIAREKKKRIKEDDGEREETTTRSRGVNDIAMTQGMVEKENIAKGKKKRSKQDDGKREETATSSGGVNDIAKTQRMKEIEKIARKERGFAQAAADRARDIKMLNNLWKGASRMRRVCKYKPISVGNVYFYDTSRVTESLDDFGQFIVSTKYMIHPKSVNMQNSVNEYHLESQAKMNTKQ